MTSWTAFLLNVVGHGSGVVGNRTKLQTLVATPVYLLLFVRIIMIVLIHGPSLNQRSSKLLKARTSAKIVSNEHSTVFVRVEVAVLHLSTNAEIVNLRILNAVSNSPHVSITNGCVAIASWPHQKWADAHFTMNAFPRAFDSFE